jgi:hypothetical protein
MLAIVELEIGDLSSDGDLGIFTILSNVDLKL